MVECMNLGPDQLGFWQSPQLTSHTTLNLGKLHNFLCFNLRHLNNEDDYMVAVIIKCDNANRSLRTMLSAQKAPAKQHVVLILRCSEILCWWLSLSGSWLLNRQMSKLNQVISQSPLVSLCSSRETYKDSLEKAKLCLGCVAAGQKWLAVYLNVKIRFAFKLTTFRIF